MAITAKLFGRTAAGKDVYEYTLTNENGYVAKILEYGCIVAEMNVPTKRGPQDVVLGYDTMERHENGTCHYGMFVGRCANRIRNAEFTVDGKTYFLPQNDGKNHLHGTFENHVFQGTIDGDTLVLTTESPDGEEGYPGAMQVTVRVTLTEENALVLDYTANTDAKTIVNFTNHSYFNLNGQDGGDLHHHALRIYADAFTENDEENCPTGRVLPVRGTPMDFTVEKVIARDIEKDYYQLTMAKGYDHNYVLNKESEGMLALAAVAKGLETGIVMETYTTQPGVQLYTANYVGQEGPIGKGNRDYKKQGSFCLETQHFPCAPSNPEFPDITLCPEDEYHETTIYRFHVEE